MKIDDLNTNYIIPGFELESPAVEPGESWDDYGDIPYSQAPVATDEPLPASWQELLGLNLVPPDPSQIDPPTRPPFFNRKTAAKSQNTPRGFLQSASSDTEDSFLSPEVSRMIGLLAAYEREVGRIRARAGGSGR